MVEPSHDISYKTTPNHEQLHGTTPTNIERFVSYKKTILSLTW